MAIKKSAKTATAKTRKSNKEFVNITDAVGTVFDVTDNGIWLSNGTYSPRFNINMDNEGKQVLSGFTKHITVEGCVCEVIENERGYAELVIKPYTE